ncbi:MAG TPA: hypothetical protein ENN46_00155 [Candidatus Woesearchaeota archaeon]|nr:hypothetical protein [Candidatus Woesearchaeota archaeon]
MAFDENFESMDERRAFDNELDDYIAKRSKEKKTKPARKPSQNRSVEVIEREPIHRKIIRKIKTVFIVEDKDGFDEPHEVEREIVEEVIVEEPEPEALKDDFDDSFDDEKPRKGFLCFIRRLFASKKWENDDEEIFDEAVPEDESREFLDNELKTVFEFTNKTIKTLPKELILKIKSMPEFENYKKVIKRYNDRKLRGEEGEKE